MSRLFLAPFAVLLGVGCTDSPAFQAASESYDGTVQTADGAPISGAIVTALRADSVVALSVYSDEDGRFSVPDLEGPHQLIARRVGYAPVTMSNDQRGEAVEFILEPVADVFDQLPSSAFLTLLPDGEEKRLFLLDCGGCHQFDQKMLRENGAARTRESWVQRTHQMLSFAGANTGFPVMAPSRNAEATVDFLSAHIAQAGRFSAEAAPIPVLADGERVVITEYDLPVPFDLPHDLMPDAEGRIIITGMMTNQMYILDPDSAHFDAVPIPPKPAGARALDIAPDGTWWVLLGVPQQIAGYDPAAGRWQTFDIGMYPHSIKRDDVGRLWFNGHFTKNPELIGYLDPATGAVRTYEVPTPPMPDGGSTIPYGLRIDRGGTIWATQLVGNRLIKFVPETEQFTLYDLPTTNSGPRRPDIGPDGIVWIPEFTTGKLARFDPAAETFTEYDLPITDALPYIVRVDPRSGVVWIATAAADAVLRFDPVDEQFSVYPLPTHKALIRHMELDPETGAPWVAYGNSPATDPKIARIDVQM